MRATLLALTLLLGCARPAPAPADRGLATDSASVLRRAEALRDRMCRCRDRQCRDRAMLDFQEQLESRALQGPTGDRPLELQLQQLFKKILECAVAPKRKAEG